MLQSGPGSTQSTHISHGDEGLRQLPDAVLPMKPGQQRKAKGHIEKHRHKHVGLPERRGPMGVSGEGGLAGGGQRGLTWCKEVWGGGACDRLL